MCKISPTSLTGTRLNAAGPSRGALAGIDRSALSLDCVVSTDALLGAVLLTADCDEQPDTGSAASRAHAARSERNDTVFMMPLATSPS